MTKIERRVAPVTLEIRAGTDGTRPKIVGRAAVFNSLSHDLGGWRETIDPGAFKRTLKSSGDVLSFLNHDPNFVIGRRSNKTLTIEESDQGLEFEVEPPATRWADDLLVSMERGDIGDASFMFRVVKDDWSTAADGKTQIRTLKEVQLFELGPVTMGAYPAANSTARSLILAEHGIDYDELARVVLLGQRATPLAGDELAFLTATMDTLRGFTVDPSKPGHSTDYPPDYQSALRARRIALMRHRPR